eukprot:TRINITY_DN24050_c0_g2_i2.p3 TRINITY_DN24050_c0_g2~~TRINITY_DN24050_c0_g2_i2.p3  ORF type:complete len:115 (+),score=4.48 TRINITY_DN24050_c0_g2_i2:89-433(+)
MFYVRCPSTTSLVLSCTNLKKRTLRSKVTPSSKFEKANARNLKVLQLQKSDLTVKIRFKVTHFQAKNIVYNAFITARYKNKTKSQNKIILEQNTSCRVQNNAINEKQNLHKYEQ